MEITTAIGVTAYLLYLEEFILALISTVVFGKLFVFHFVMEYFDRKGRKSVAMVNRKGTR